VHCSLLSKHINIEIHTTIIFPVILYECENWSVVLREERRPRAYENLVLSDIFGLRGTR
jgi:hypothetical protein